MGPAAWLAVGRALVVAIARGAVFGPDGAVRLLVEQVCAAIERRDFDVARAMIRNMQREHRAALEVFIAKYRDDLPEEFQQELSRAGN